MSMSIGGGGPDGPMMEMNMTPWIGGLLVLLLRLTITNPGVAHAVKLDMPRPTNQPQQNVLPVVIQLEIDFDGTVLWNGSPVTIDSLRASGLSPTFAEYMRRFKDFVV